MTDQAIATTRPIGQALRAIPVKPAEGWLSLLAIAVMLFALAASLQDAGWTPGEAQDSGFLAWMGFIGLAFGFAGAKLGWGRWRSHLVGATFAGLVVPLVVGGIIIGQGVGWDPQAMAERVAATLRVAEHAWQELFVLRRPFTTEIDHYHLVFGSLMWGAGMLAGFTVFGHRRPLDAIVVLGLILLANMALTKDDDGVQVRLLVMFTAAALLLLISTHVFEEQVTWSRRRIGDPSTVGHLYLYGGAKFVTFAVTGAVLLTFLASSAPLQGLWQDLPRQFQAAAQWLQRFAPPGLDPRGIGAVGFGESSTTNGLWQPSGDVAFRAQFAANEKEHFKWRAGTYAEYQTFGWGWGTTRSEPTAPRATLLAGDEDAPIAAGRREISFHVIPAAFKDPTVLSPNSVQWVDQQAQALVVGTGGWFTSVETAEGIGSYNVSALVPIYQTIAGGITEPRLRAAGKDYPPEVLTIYTALPPDAMGEASTALLASMRAAVTAPSYADPDNPYDLARTMQAILRDSERFTYVEDVRTERNAQCGGVSSVECFARIKRGYCEYYASTMAVLLRASGVPARVAYGFLPGDRNPAGLEVVGAWAAHWWVEVYFPGIGWIEFDPTGGNGALPPAIPTGSAGPATPRASRPAATNPLPSGGPVQVPPGGTPPSSSIGPFIAIGVILLLGFGALAFAAYRRTPNRPMHPDQAWGSLGRLAARFGLGPTPSQTVYEYAGTLGEAVPAARVELTTIARAKVEVAYGKRDLGSDRLRSIAAAYHRLRFAILGVVLRRGLRRRKRR